MGRSLGAGNTSFAARNLDLRSGFPSRVLISAGRRLVMVVTGRGCPASPQPVTDVVVVAPVLPPVGANHDNACGSARARVPVLVAAVTRRIVMGDAPVQAQADYAEYVACGGAAGWGVWWARYGADYIENAAEEPAIGGDAGPGSSAVHSVPGRAPGSAALKRAPELAEAEAVVRPAGQRSLRNDIARSLLEGYDLTWPQLRSALQTAAMAVEACSNWVLVFGPQSLIDEVSR